MNDRKDNWISVNEHLPENDDPVNVAVKSTRKFRIFAKAACFIQEKTLALHDDCDPFIGCYHDEGGDECYVPEGWYEMEHEDDMAMRSKVEGVVFWMPLPDLP